MLFARIICVYCNTKPLTTVPGVCVKYQCDSCTLGLLLLSAALQGDKRIDSIIIIRSSEFSIQPTTIGEGWTGVRHNKQLILILWGKNNS